MTSSSHDYIKFFFEGDDYFESLWTDLLATRYSIFIEMYKLEDDEIGRHFKEILIDKSRQGITVKIIIDAIGCINLPNSYITELKEAGIQVRIYHPLRLILPSRLQLNKREHRKVVIIDAEIGYLGGINLFRKASLKYYGDKRWQDTQVKITGQMLSKMVYHFKRSFKDIRFRSKRMERFFHVNDIIATRNQFGRNHIRRFIKRYIRRSRSIIRITTAYFIPDIETIIAIKRAIKRGVRVQIITNGPEHCDIPQVNRINRPILKYLIKKGAEIFYFKDRMLHSKSIVFDNKFATTGSTNINYRSFFRDVEINVFFRKERWVSELKKQFDRNLAASRPVTLEELKNISWWDKIIDGFFYLLRSFF